MEDSSPPFTYYLPSNQGFFTSYASNLQVRSPPIIQEVDDGKRHYNFFGVCYMAPQFLISYATQLKDLKQFYFICHDKDVDEFGQPEEPHTHFLLILNNNHTAKSVQRSLYLWQGLNPQTVRVDTCISVTGALRYLVHKDHPNKFQYHFGLVFSYGNGALDKLLNALSIDDKSFDVYVIASQLRLAGESLENIGRRFPQIIKNYKNFKAYCQDVELERKY